MGMLRPPSCGRHHYYDLYNYMCPEGMPDTDAKSDGVRKVVVGAASCCYVVDIVCTKSL
jgi:hypothetical protein